MYEPKYSINDRLLNLIVDLEINRVLMEQAGLPSGLRTKQREKAKALSLFHLAHMLGLNVTVRDAEKLAEGRKLPIEDARANIINNFRNVLEFNRSNVAGSFMDLDLTMMLHLNKILLNGWKESWDVKIRTAGDSIDPTLDDWIKYQNPQASQGDVEAKLKELLEWYKIEGSRIHPILRVGVLVYRLIEILPFVGANKLTIIALADFFLFRYGYVSKTYLPITRNFDLYADEYFEAWEICKKKFDLTLWLERFARNLGKDLKENRSEIDRIIGEEKEKSSKQPFLDLNKRQLKVLRYLQTIPTVKRDDYCQMMDVSTMTAYRDLDALVQKKLIRVEGRGRGTKYMLVSR